MSGLLFAHWTGFCRAVAACSGLQRARLWRAFEERHGGARHSIIGRLSSHRQDFIGQSSRHGQASRSGGGSAERAISGLSLTASGHTSGQ